MPGMMLSLGMLVLVAMIEKRLVTSLVEEGRKNFKGTDFPPCFYPGFRSLFQGDHLGVEFALRSHQTVLEEGDLVHVSDQVLGGHLFPSGPHYTGLIIDDYFAIGAEEA